MGQLQIITVTGAIPHTACYIDYEGMDYADRWLGFGPSEHHRSGWPSSVMGKIFDDDESYRMNHGIVFDRPDTQIARAVAKVCTKYATARYQVGHVDCVSCMADLARYCGLEVPFLNMTPFGFIRILGFWNTCVKQW